MAMTDESGVIAESYSYDAYGKVTTYGADGGVLNSSNLALNSYTYTGRRIDKETGLMYFRVRYYSPELGRFISRDPLQFVDGMNLYAGYFALWGGIDPMGTKLCFKYGDAKYMEQVKKDIEQLKKDHPDVKGLIESLEESSKYYRIGLPEDNKGAIFRPNDGVDNDKNGKMFRYNAVGYDPNNKTPGAWLKSQKEKQEEIIPRVALAHELQHASDYDKGRLIKERKMYTRNKVKRSEVRAVNTENKIRAKTGDKKRTSYKGGEITDADFDKSPGYKVDENNNTQKGCSQ